MRIADYWLDDREADREVPACESYSKTTTTWRRLSEAARALAELAGIDA
jgi:hypothetical protein